MPPPIVQDNDRVAIRQQKQSLNPPAIVNRDWKAAYHIVNEDKVTFATGTFFSRVRSTLEAYQCNIKNGVVKLTSKNIDLFLSQKPKLKKFIMIICSNDDTPGGHTDLPKAQEFLEALDLAWEKLRNTCCIGRIVYNQRRKCCCDSFCSGRCALLQKLNVSTIHLPLLLGVENGSKTHANRLMFGPKTGSTNKIGDSVHRRETVHVIASPNVKNEPTDTDVSIFAKMPIFHKMIDRTEKHGKMSMRSRNTSGSASITALQLSTTITSFIKQHTNKMRLLS